MEVRIYDSELKLMELIWKKKGICAKELSLLAEKDIGWNKNTTYTILKRLIEKGYIERCEPGFICKALISREEVQRNETTGLLKRLFGNSKSALISMLLEDELISKKELAELKNMIEDL